MKSKKYFLYLLLLSFCINLNATDEDDEDDDDSKYTEIHCELKPILRLRDSSDDNILKNLVDRQTIPHIPVTTRISNAAGTSNNWAGYVVGKDLRNLSVALNSVSFVRGTWRVPNIAPSTVSTYCATWVGIDGFNNKTVEQIGTEQEYLVSSSFTGQFNYAWVEMFPQNAQIISGFPVSSGDTIRGAVRYIGNNHFSLTLVNVTKNVKTTLIRTLAVESQRICAEWIVEAPFLKGVLPLGNFTKVNFFGCRTIIDGIAGTIRNNNWQRLRLNMVSQNSVLKASTSGLNTKGNAFTCRWHHQ